MSLTTTGQGGNTPGFWDLRNMRIDSLVGKALLVGGGGYVLYKLLPIINTIVWNTVSIVGGCLILIALWFAIVDGRFIRLLDYAYRSLIRLLVGFFVTLDPIGIMKSYLQDVVKAVREFSERIGDLRGAIESTEEDLATYKREYAEAMAYVAAARKKGEEDDPSVQTQANIAERRRVTIEEVGKLLALMKSALAMLERYYNKSVAYREDLKDNISSTERKRKTLKIASSAFQKAALILRGDSVGAEFYDAAVEAAKEQAGAMVGEMKQWVFESQDVIKAFEMKQAANVELALQRLEEKEQSGGSLLLEYKPGETVDMTVPLEKVPVHSAPASAQSDIRRFMNS